MKPRFLLNQIRQDLRGLDPDQQRRVEKSIGKSPRYLTRATAEHLKLETIFTLGRCLGYGPSEYLSRLLQKPPNYWVQPGPVGLFRGLSHLARKSSRSDNLHDFLQWGYGVTIREGDGPTVDLQERLSTLGVELSTKDTLEYADVVFSLYARNSPDQLAEESIRSLVGSMCLVIEILRRESFFHEACRALDLAFYLESLIQDVALRRRLFDQGGRLCLELQQPLHGVWCLREAGFLALLAPDYDQARSLHQQATQVAREAGLADRPAKLDAAELGAKDLDLLFSIMATDRRASSITAADLDSHLGAQKAFTMAVKRRAPMSVERWRRFVEALGVSPSLQLRRLDLLQEPVVPMGKFMQRLKVGSHERRAFAWQTELLSWCESVEISSTAPRIAVFGGDAWTMPPDQAFEPVSQSLAHFTSNALSKCLHPIDATTLINGLLRLAHVLRLKSQLNDAADMVDTVFSLEDRHPQNATESMIYRSASTLALYLGTLNVSIDLLNRAKMTDVTHWNPKGLVLTHYWEGTAAQLSTSYKDALGIHQACLEPARRHGGVPLWLLYSSLAWSALRIGDVSRAGRLLERGQEEKIPPHCVQFLWTRAEFLSLSGAESEAMKVLESTQRIILAQGYKTDLILIKIEKCRHLLRYGRLHRARDQARQLLSSTRDLDENPIGKAALLELVREIFCGEWKLDSIQQVMRRIQLPHLVTQETRSHT